METTALFSVTDRAISRLRAVAQAENVDPATDVLRVAVIAGGCSGLTYDLGWDTVVQPTDETVEVGGDGGPVIRIVVDPRSLLTLEGTTLDFTDGLDGRGFAFDNPQASRTCACGESFSL
jgi:iron-sulfur cluster assembly protein